MLFHGKVVNGFGPAVLVRRLTCGAGSNHSCSCFLMLWYFYFMKFVFLWFLIVFIFCKIFKFLIFEKSWTIRTANRLRTFFQEWSALYGPFLPSGGVRGFQNLLFSGFGTRVGFWGFSFYRTQDISWLLLYLLNNS